MKALISFFSLFGLPKIVQSDQGTNFMLRVFKQALKLLGITHRPSSCYHPESQGALERWHQMLKSMLRAYCFHFERDWDDGVPLVLFAVRKAAQESLGFSSSELVFGHTVCGPLKLLKDKWLPEKNTPKNVPNYVSDFCFRLHRVPELAKKNLVTAQKKINSI